MIVYLLKLPDNKAYIGSTIDLEKRLREHKCASKTKPMHQFISNEINKYGWDYVKAEVLLICETRKEAYFQEARLIKELGNMFNLINKLDRPESWHNSQKRKSVSSEQMSEISNKFWSDPENRKHMSIVARRRALADRLRMSTIQRLSRESFVSRRPLVRVYSKDGSLLIETRSTIEIAKLIGVNQTSVCRYVRGERRPNGFKIEVVLCP